jgi:2-polyprenyl-3-methyl-5-hydroxy-6-metoxy-1,4-benzoquinol methylase
MHQTSDQNCRHCKTPLEHLFVDLGVSPPCQSRVLPEQLNSMEPFYPLRVFVCHVCFLVQLGEYVSPDEIFTEYAYFSSYSESWVQHSKDYADAASRRFKLGPDSLVMEVASNDGYLLQHFDAAGIPVLGIEPAANVARVAIDKGIPTEVRFLGSATAADIVSRHGQADLVVGNNVLAHVPDINDFVRGLGILSRPDGIITMEFPHLLQLIDNNQFDTIYHEHFSYLSLHTVRRIFAAQDLAIFDVEELPTHGGSIRIYAGHLANTAIQESPALTDLLKRELDWGVNRLPTYRNFSAKVALIKRELLDFLCRAKSDGKVIVGYGAPGKGNTLLNYCGIRTDFLEYTVDQNPYKQGSFTPGTHIPILTPEAIAKTKPDFVLILPWNLRNEIAEQMKAIRHWGGQFVCAIPRLDVF